MTKYYQITWRTQNDVKLFMKIIIKIYNRSWRSFRNQNLSVLNCFEVQQKSICFYLIRGIEIRNWMMTTAISRNEYQI